MYALHRYISVSLYFHFQQYLIFRNKLFLFEERGKELVPFFKPRTKNDLVPFEQKKHECELILFYTELSKHC